MPPADGEGRAGAHEFGRETLDVLERDADRLRHLIRRREIEPRRVRRNRAETLAQDHLRHGERECPFAAGRHTHPFVGHERGLRHPRGHVDEFGHPRALTGFEAVRPRECALEGDWREPGFHEVGAERQDVFRRRKVVGGKTRVAESGPVAFPQRLERERLVGHVASADLLGPFVHQLAEAAGLETGEEHDPLAGRRAELALQRRHRLFPGHGLEVARRATLHGARDAVGVVEPLQGGLTARA